MRPASGTLLPNWVTVYHELGHCVLGETHTQRQDAIMNPVINCPMWYMWEWSQMVKDLFNAMGDGLTPS